MGNNWLEKLGSGRVAFVVTEALYWRKLIAEPKPTKEKKMHKEKLGILKELVELDRVGYHNAIPTLIRMIDGDFDKELEEYVKGTTYRSLAQFIDMLRDLTACDSKPNKENN